MNTNFQSFSSNSQREQSEKNKLSAHKATGIKLFNSSVRAVAAACVLLTAVPSCNRIGPESGQETVTGTLRIHFSENSYKQTRANDEAFPDTSAFILNVTDSKGKEIYNGTFGDSPENLIVSQGTYNISVRSGKFSAPAFASPLYGDDQCVTVASNGTTDVYLVCEQINSGIALKVASNFLTSYPNGVLFLKSADGKLMYAFKEKRTAYFNPGNVSLILNDNGADKTLFTRTLKARQILTVSISAPSSQTGAKGGGIHIDVDTSRIWLNEDFVINGGSSSDGGSSSGDSYKNALSVSQAKSEIGAEDVWVYGYIVGGDMTSSSISFDEPFSSNTNIAIAGRTTVSEKESCLSVNLHKGDIRDALNLADNPENLKKKVYLKGDIVEAYFGIPGIKNVSDYVLE